MNIESLKEYCLSLKSAEMGLPFGDETLVFSVKGKMFCATGIEQFEFINVKCDPERAITLREEYEDVIPGFHMNKKHWNSLRVKGKLSDTQLKEWIRDSYDLVIAGMPKKLRQELDNE